MTPDTVSLRDWRVVTGESAGPIPLGDVPDAEQALVGLALNDPRQHQPDLDATLLREPLHRRMWRLIGELVAGEGGAPVDGPALASVVVSRMWDDPALQELGGRSYLADLMDKAPLQADPRALAGEVHRIGIERTELRLRDADGVLGATDAEWAETERARGAALWSPQGRRLKLVDPSGWADDAAPVREWAWRDNMPLGQATFLTGAGSAGKSLLGQQGSTCSALGVPLLGVEMRQAISLYVTCEDDMEELQRRQDAICYALGVRMSDLRGQLHLCSLMGEVGNELCLFDRDGRMKTTPAWERLRATVLEADAGFIVLDNIAHLFGGNEIIRSQVAGFCSLMNALAVEGRKRAVLFIGHPNKNGDAYSGSTAWENQVRSRLFLGRQEATKDEPVVDHDARTLSRGKSNYAQKGGEITFRWWRGAFVRDADLPAAEGAQIAAEMWARADDERFLACLAKATEERRAVSTARNASSFAPRLFAAMPTAAGVTLDRFERAMERLLHGGMILAAQRVFQRENRAWVTGLGLAPRSAPTPAPTDAQGCTGAGDDPL